MRLRIVTPLTVAVDQADVHALRAEDASGGFGILPCHTDFLTSLTVGVVRWGGGDGVQHFCAVRRGVLSVDTAHDVTVATREAVLGDDLGALEGSILAGFQKAADAERTERVDSTRLQLKAIRQIVGRLRPGPSS